MRFSQGYKPSGVVRQQQPDISIDDDFDMVETLYGVGYRFKQM